LGFASPSSRSRSRFFAAPLSYDGLGFIDSCGHSYSLNLNLMQITKLLVIFLTIVISITVALVIFLTIVISITVALVISDDFIVYFRYIPAGFFFKPKHVFSIVFNNLLSR
jgi:hypothetical protein